MGNQVKDNRSDNKTKGVYYEKSNCLLAGAFDCVFYMRSNEVVCRSWE